MGHLHSGLTYDKSPFQRKVLYFQGMKVDISQLSIFYQTFLAGMALALEGRCNMPKRKELEVLPVSNAPELSSEDIFSSENWEIANLRRRLAAAHADKKTLNDKLTLSLDLLVSELRMWRLGLREGQWETMGQIQARVAKLEGMVKMLLESAPGRHTMVEEHARLFGGGR